MDGNALTTRAKGGRMKRLTFDGNFCDIAMCQETPGSSFCEDGYCTQRKVWDRLKQYEDMEEQGLLVRLPCKLGDTVYRVIGNCTFPGDCGTKRMCKGCEYRILYIEEDVFYPGLLTDSGKLSSRYYTSREEAEKALEEA